MVDVASSKTLRSSCTREHEFDVPRKVIEAYVDSMSPERRTLLERYRVVDAARKVVGVGSVGTRCHVVL